MSSAPKIWEGGRDDRTAPRPPRGQWVVYTLTDDDGDVIYAGMSSQLSTRLRAHRAKAWPWVTWAAMECMSELDAAVQERGLIAQLQPTYNVAGRA